MTEEIIEYRGVEIFKQEAEVLKRIHIKNLSNVEIKDYYIVGITLSHLHREFIDPLLELNNLEKLTLLSYEKVPILVFSMTNLKMLVLNSMFVNEGELDGIGKLKNLKKLSLINIRSYSDPFGHWNLPESIFKLGLLEELTIASCSISKVPQNIGDLQRLKKICLQANNIEVLPLSLFTIKNLIEFDCGSNKIKEIPEEIEFLINLEKLVLWTNHIKKIQESKSKLTKIKSIIISNNHLVEVPECIGHLPNLERLFIDIRSLKKLPNSLIERIIEYDMNQKYIRIFAKIPSSDSKRLEIHTYSNKSIIEQINQNFDLLDSINYENPSHFISDISVVLKIYNVDQSKSFLENLDSNKLKNLAKLPQASNIENLTEILLEYWEDDINRRNHSQMISKLYRLMGSDIEQFLIDNIISPSGFLRLSIIDALEQINGLKPIIKDIITKQTHQMKLSFKSFIINKEYTFDYNLIYILNTFLKVFNIGELLEYLRNCDLKLFRNYNIFKRNSINEIIFDVILLSASSVVKEKFFKSEEGIFLKKYGKELIRTTNLDYDIQEINLLIKDINDF